MARNHLFSSLKESAYTEEQDAVLHLPFQDGCTRMPFAATGNMVGNIIAQKA